MDPVRSAAQKAEGDALSRQRRHAYLQKEAAGLLALRKEIHKLKLTGQSVEAEKVSQRHQRMVKELNVKTGHRPGHKQQFLDVWNQEDGLFGLQFDPKTFFRLHDINGDGALDTKEVEALMWFEAKGLHTSAAEGFNERAAREEAETMRDVMMKEYDSNRDDAVDYREFLEFAEVEVCKCCDGCLGLIRQLA